MYESHDAMHDCSEGSLWELVLSLCPGEQTQIARVGGKCLYPLNYPTHPQRKPFNVKLVGGA